MKNFTLLMLLLFCYSCITKQNNSVKRGAEFKDTSEIVGDPTMTPLNYFIPDDEDSTLRVFPNPSSQFEIANFEYLYMDIYNRWGVLVFEGDIFKDGGWNGKACNTGPDCPEGTYFIASKYRLKDGDGKIEEFHTTLMLFRL